jgi:signal transduction histidine kinase/AmiR/NasT family two-component response regulator
VLDRFESSMQRTFGSLDAVPPAWRALLEEVGEALAHAEQERERMRLAMERTSIELRELLVELDALRRARLTAESTNLVRGEILATVGRTMRTPADAILGLTGLLRTGALLPTQRAYVDAVYGAAEALRGILNDVSDFSSLEAGTLPLEPIRFDLRVMVNDMAAALSVQADAKGIGLRFAWRPDAPRRVLGDPGRIRQVVTALIADGLTRVQRGEIVVEVGRGKLGPEGGVRIAVEDTGPAIPGDVLPTLFEPFGRGDVYPVRQGGLGLPISRQLVHLMGGTLGVENVAGGSGGSRFTLELPLAAVEEPAAPGEASQQAELVMTPGTSPRLIVVEADDHQRASWTAIANAAGFEPSGCARCDEVIEELRRQPASLVLFSDHDAEGYDAIGRRILENERLGRPALIMLPAVGNPGDARRLRDAGFRGYLVKPVVPADLRELLETLRRTARARWHTLFLTRHVLAEARREGAPSDAEVDANLEHLVSTAESAASPE